jgi:hypothetical protein
VFDKDEKKNDKIEHTYEYFPVLSLLLLYLVVVGRKRKLSRELNMSIQYEEKTQLGLVCSKYSL